MKSKISILLCAVLTLASPGLYAATLVVLPGQSIQATITSASPGDQIIIKGGTYVESITIDKNLDFRREAGSVVHINGNVTLSGITGAFTFAHFKIGSDNNKLLTVTNCTDVYMEDVNATGGGGLSVTNSKVRGKHCWFSTTGNITGATEFYFYDCSFGGDVSFTSSNWTMQECSITGNLNSNTSDTIFLGSNVTGYLYHNQTDDTNCTIFQSTIGQRLLTKAKRSWIGYNSIRYMAIQGGALEAEIVGNNINLTDGGARCIEIDATNISVHIRNNVMRNTWTGNNEGGSYGTTGKCGVWIWKCQKALICNNEFNHLHGPGILLRSDFGGSATVTGNLFFVVKSNMISAPFENVIFSHNFRESRSNQSGAGWTGGGVVNGEGNVYGDSTLPISSRDLDWSTIPNTLQDKGSPDPEFKDHDGTRQDIGIKGGHHFDTNGTTSSIPVVLSGNLTPIRIQKGVTGTVNLNSRAVVSTPK
jgi:hypothetical protein